MVVPASLDMVSLLGSGDELLRAVERSFPAWTFMSEATKSGSSGEPADVVLVERLLDELVTVIRTGQGLSPEAVERSAEMLQERGG